jgi:hypothetical protein
MNGRGPIAPYESEKADLGAEVLRCRRLSGAQTFHAQGYLFGWFLYYVLYPLVILPYIAAMTICLPVYLFAKLFGHSFEAMLDTIAMPILGGAFLILYAMTYWFTFIRPRADYFVLHENGLRIRSGFKRLDSPFKSIQGIFVGRAPSKLEGALRRIVDVLKPSQAEWLNQLDGTAVSLVLVDGTTRLFKALLTCFEPSDLERLFNELVKRNPRFGDNETAQSFTAEPFAAADRPRDTR